MMLRWLLLLTSVVMLKTTSAATANDATRQPGTKGSDVVNAVVNIIRAKCVLSEDRLFLRRLAYVESRDGTDPDTYKAGYNGGIWKVSQSMLAATTTCPSVIRQTCDVISREFNIDWTKVTWLDLRKPLYSGLAAALYLITRLGSNTPPISATLEGQADQWAHYYHFGRPERNYTELAAEATGYECKDPMDIAFILDGSGSISFGDFNLSLRFVADVVSAMDIPNVARVAVIVFESLPYVQFTFDQYQTKPALLAAIHSIKQTSGGTATDLAIDKARTSLFTAAGGARPNAKRLAVLVTDGQSNDPVTTGLAADRLRNERGVTVLAIGVGGYDLDELHAIASDPPCSHTFTLPDFSVIDSILYEIQRSTCTASRYTATNEVMTLPEGVHHVDSGNGTLTFETRCGIAHVYVSYTNPNPNPAVYNQMLTATDGRPAYLTTQATNNGQTVYLTVVGTKLPPDQASLSNCTDFSVNITRTNGTVEVMCVVDKTCRECTDDMIWQDARIRELINCDHDNQFEFHNPCDPAAMAAGHVIFPYPYDPNKFIRCDYQGNPYVTLCPHRLPFNKDTLACGYTGGSNHRHPLPPTHKNPCTSVHIEAQYLYFAYDEDRSKFIHCDLFGGAWLEQCPVLEIWSQEKQTCVADTSNAPVATTCAPHPFHNPCTPEAVSTGQLYYPYPCDHTRFIHCDTTGNYWVQFCPGGLYYDPSTFTCVLGDPQGNHGCDCVAD